MKQDKRNSTWTVVGLVIVIAWLIAAGIYFYNRMPIFRGSAALADRSNIEGPASREEWMGLYHRKNKIGYNHYMLKATEDGYLIKDEMLLRINLLGEIRETRVMLDSRLAGDWVIRDFNIEARSDMMDFAASGVVKDYLIELTVKTAGSEIKESIPFSQKPYLYTTWVFAEELKRQGLEIGSKASLPMFDPVSRSMIAVELEVADKEDIEVYGQVVPAFKIRESFSGQEQWLWLSEDGEVLKEEHESGFMALRESRDQAIAFAEEDPAALDLITTLVVKTNTSLINPRDITFLRAKLEKAELTNLDLVSDGQANSGREVTVISKKEDIPETGYQLPFDSAFPGLSEEFSDFLESDLSAQSDDPRIIKAARRAAGRDSDAVSVARKLTGWVSREVRDSMVMSIPSAIEVLEKKRGACKEHTVLYVAMARALGLPARMVSGIVYSEDQLIDGFYYHAWPEVYLADENGRGGAWVPVDPTFNQFPADATHIRLKQGGMEKMTPLMGVVGQLEVKIEEYH